MDHTQTPATADVARSAVRKVAWRLVPFVALMFFINYLDRTAIGFAAPNGMNEDLGLSAAQFGFASGVFFIGYMLLLARSNRIAPIERIVDEDAHVAVAETKLEGPTPR